MTFSREYTVRATRKAHRCETCGKSIEIGSPAARWAGKTEDGFCSLVYHPDCRAAEVALNNLRDYRDGDDWGRLGDIDSEDYDWLLGEFPAVAARMGIMK